MTGTILAVSGSWSSGIATITIEDDKTQDSQVILADNGPLFRALRSMFGGILSGHRFDPRAVVGKRVRYQFDDMGMLSYIGPIDPDLEEDI